MTFRGSVGVVGQGYVGLPLAMAAYRAGWKVYGFDNDPIRIERIISGYSPVEDVPSLELGQALSSGLYIPSINNDALNICDIVIVCVPTPLNDSGEPDLSILMEAIRQIAPKLNPKAMLINESTSFPGTVRKVIAPLIEQIRGSVDIDIACAPERVDPGNFEWSQKNTPRLVGGLTSDSVIRAKEFYGTFCNSVIEVSCPEVAELAKLLENSFRQVNIALVNDLARLAERMGVDVWEVISAADTKPYGFMKFLPSVGVGGHCIPVDPIYLSHAARELGSPMKLIEIAQEINDGQPGWVGSKAVRLLGGSVKDKRIHLMGMGYKAGTFDTRESPSVRLYEELTELGAKCTWSDDLILKVKDTPPTSLSDEVDLIIYCQVQKNLDLEALSIMRAKILDCTGTLLKSSQVVSI